ncbi:phage late control D family protein [Bradyrhizobium tropiciagri]|uniref:phage late control D family protein n=1 Tax=Bradyrhizobium tropiciagri TaxID=312253 RepID=UPI00067B9C8A|nr:contractile injection system protein, VgrG/Pvc8 family [Bradyrhizobium tropiciagri]
MANSYTLTLGGQSADSTLYSLITSLEVEEGMDMASAIQISLPVSRTDQGDLTYISDSRFAPLAPVAVVATASGGAGGGTAGPLGAVASALGGGSAFSAAQCIFDGYVLSQKLRLETGVTNSTASIWGQDASWLMSQTEKSREWADVTDADVAATIFGEYGITPSDQNSQDDSASHTSDTHSLMQRGTDIAFLRMLARRGGKVCRIACADTPGQRTGFFATPKLDGDPAFTLTLNDPANWTVSALDFEWDATRPTAVVARSALFSDSDPEGAVGDTSDSGLKNLSDSDLATFAGQPTTVMLTAAVDNAGDLTLRAKALLREAGWFARCDGEADADRLGVVLRPGMLVAVKGVGATFSGSWLVWSVRHKFTQEGHKMNFTLLRNGVGAAGASGGGLLSALAGAL